MREEVIQHILKVPYAKKEMTNTHIHTHHREINTIAVYNRNENNILILENSGIIMRT